jgi:tetratricopeptide (TPR) repeat protein
MKFMSGVAKKLLRWTKRFGVHNQIRLLCHRASLLQQKNDRSGARALLLEALSLQRTLANREIEEDILSWLASTWFFEEQFEEEIAFFTAYLVDHPNSSACYRERAPAFWYLGDIENALKDYSRAIELNSSDMRPLCGRGQVFAEIGKAKEALDDLDRALVLFHATWRINAGPNWYVQFEAYARNGRGLALATQGEHGLAMAEFDASLELAPDNAWAYYNRASVYDNAGDRLKAAEDYARSLQKSGPKLNRIRRERATSRLRDLSGQ